MPTPHRLTEKDKVALTATCSICGPAVRIAKNGKYGFVCVVGRREAKKRWAKAHPEKAKENRRFRASPHRLEVRDGSPDRCPICGPVEPVAWGRGWMCPTRAAELNRRPAAAPTPKCPKCLTLFVTAAGTCLACDDREAVDLGHSIMVDEHLKRANRRNPAWQSLVADGEDADDRLAFGYSVVEGGLLLTDENESAVKGWKTLGSSARWDAEPAVRSDYAALYGAGKGKAS